MKYNKLFAGSFIVLFTLAQISCKPEKDTFIEEREKAISEAWTLLDHAEKSPEVEMSVPLGFVLGNTEKEFNKQCENLGKQFGGHKYGSMYQLRTDEFQVRDSVLIQHSNYFSDPNTETDIVDGICFILNDIGLYETSEIDTLIFLLDAQLADWMNAEFNATDKKPSKKYDNYHKFWVKENLAVHLEVHFSTTSIDFLNIPKHGTKWLKQWIGTTIQISEEVTKKIEERAKLPKIENSPWDGSVYQVKKYLKNNLKDPDSYEGIEWSKVVRNANGYYTVLHKFRARNSFGGMVIETWSYELDEAGNVVSAVQL